MTSDIKAHIVKGINSLPINEQLILSLYYEQRLTFKDIARVMDLRLSNGLPNEPLVRRLYMRGVTKCLNSFQLNKSKICV